MSNVRIAPSLLSADFGRLAEEVRSAEEAGADLLHLDVMDGHFVPNLTIGPGVIKALRKVTRLPFDCHLMIEEPQRYIEHFVDAGADMISIHVETEAHLERALSLIRRSGASPGIAINPGTSADMLRDVVVYADYVLVMTVNPGFGGQKFIDGVVPKIRRVAGMIGEAGSKAVIEVDGGIDPTTVGAVTRAGAEILVAGTAVFGQPDRGEAVRLLRESANSVTV